jgi:hypothetical protein
MPGVQWSRRAIAKLEVIDPSVRDQLTSNVAEILHDMPPAIFPYDEGFAGEVMWHRGIACGTLSQESLVQEDVDGPWNYFLFYTPWRPGAEDPDKRFEVLDVCSIADLAERWRKMKRDSS